jgi:rSAM/selenodomain-associated transferase 2
MIITTFQSDWIAMISIITPVLNEKENIGRFLEHVNGLDGELELILVDGGSTDGTLEEIERGKEGFSHDLRVLNSQQGRGLQMNNGAKMAEGDILLFLHVDSELEKDALVVIEKKMEEGNMIGGGFTHSFHNPDRFLRLSSAFGNSRAKATKIFFGDFGIFIRKDIFDKMGGYQEIPFLEDVELCRKAKKHGELGQIDRLIVTSPRRYEKKGKYKLTAFFSLAVVLNMIGLRPQFLYQYIVEM